MLSIMTLHNRHKYNDIQIGRGHSPYPGHSTARRGTAQDAPFLPTENTHQLLAHYSAQAKAHLGAPHAKKLGFTKQTQGECLPGALLFY